eukprot:6250306-Amphidinium_carterae.1
MGGVKLFRIAKVKSRAKQKRTDERYDGPGVRSSLICRNPSHNESMSFVNALSSAKHGNSIARCTAAFPAFPSVFIANLFWELAVITACFCNQFGRNEGVQEWLMWVTGWSAATCLWYDPRSEVCQGPPHRGMGRIVCPYVWGASYPVA